MSESKLRAAGLLLKTRYDYRVVELGVGDDLTLAIRRVDYDSNGKPISFHRASPRIENRSGDGLVALLNDLAMALTKPSLVESDFEDVQ
jgi:hypothetical protein